MKFSLLTLLAFFAVTQAIRITDFKPKGSISINGTDDKNLRLSCQTDGWWHCEFRHEQRGGISGKSCQIDLTSRYEVKDQCSQGIKYKGGHENYECIVEIEDVGLEDAGLWTCIMSDYYHKKDKWWFLVLP